MANKKVFTDESLATLVSETKTYVDSAVSTKANSNHTHDDRYYTESEINTKVSNLQSGIDSKVTKESGKGLSTNDYTTTEKTKLAGIASGAQVNQNAFSNVTVGSTTIAADSTTDTLTVAAGTGISVSADATNDKITITNSGVRSIGTGSANGTISVNTNGASANIAVKGLGSAAYTASTAYDAAGTAQTKADAALASAKSYADTKVANLINGAPTTLDTLKEIADAMAANDTVVDALESAVGNKVDKVSGKGLSTNDYTTTEKNKLAGIASGAEVNQNAFSNVTVGSTTIAADGKTDTLTIASGGNITITPDASADKVTFTVADGSTSAKGVVKLTDSTSSTSTTTAATPNSVKSAYDLANTAKTTADGKAPTSHASTGTSYGIGTSSNYGHVKLSDATNSTSAASAGIAASPAAVKAAYDLANGRVPSTRKVNGKALSADITLSASDVGASASGHTHNYAGSSYAGGAANSALTIDKRIKVKSSESGSANKYIKFGTVSLPSQYSGFSGYLMFNPTEGGGATIGVLHLHIRNGSSITSTSCAMKWLTLIDSKYSETVFVVKVSDGVFDLYYKPITYWDTMEIIAISGSDHSALSLANSNTYVDSITAFATSSLGGIVNNAATATNVAWSGVTSKPSYYDAKAIKSITRSGTTFTYTCMDGTTGTFTQQDNNTTYSAATQSANGLMSAADKKKLDGIATGANKITVDTALSSTSTNPVQNKVINTALAGKSDSSHNHDSNYLKLTGGTLSSNLYIGDTSKSEYYGAYVQNSLQSGGIHVSSAGNLGVISDKYNKWLIYMNQDGTLTRIPNEVLVGDEASSDVQSAHVMNSLHRGGLHVSGNGNMGIYSTTRSKWLIYSGKDSDTVFIPNVTEISTTMANNVPLTIKSGIATSASIEYKNSSGTVMGYLGVDSNKNAVFNDTSNTYNIIHGGNYSSYALPKTGGTLNGALTVLGRINSGNTSTNGGIDIYHDTPYLDFHFGNSSSDYTTRIIEKESGKLTIQASNVITSGNLYTGATTDDTYHTIYARNKYGSGGIHVSTASNVGLMNNGISTWIIRMPSDGVCRIAEKLVLADNFHTEKNNKMTLGTASYKWKQLYAATATINTSDRNDKKDFRTFDSNENYEKFFMDLKPMVFKFKNGESGRDHFGFVSQDVEESLHKYGFDDKSFAGFCKDAIIEEVEGEDGVTREVPKLDEDGNEQYVYGLRYSEFTAMNTHMIQKVVKENQELKTKNEELETRLLAIEKMIEELKG